MRGPDDDFQPTATFDTLRKRADVLARIREFFNSRDFLEVETPILSADIVIDRHLDPFSTILADDPRRPHAGRTLYLQTSPEFAMKRLLADGVKRIYQIARVFRNGERGARHNPEFTLLEWYRAGDDLAAGMKLLAEFAEVLLERGSCEMLSYADAFEKTFGLDPHRADTSALAATAQRMKIQMPTRMSDDRDDWLNLLLAECIEPQLGRARPTILYDYPASQAALARVRDPAGSDDTGSSAVAERFELYVDGVELANGYHELLDPAVLRARNSRVNAQRIADGKPMLPEESRLLAAMDVGLPACVGVALGIDRLLMILTGVKTIDEVIAFPIDRA